MGIITNKISGSGAAIDLSGSLQYGGATILDIVNGAAKVQAGVAANNGGLAHDTGKLKIDLANLPGFVGVPHTTQDEFIISDNGIEKKIDMAKLSSGVFAHVGGDATVSSAGSLTIAANAVQDGMVHDDVAAGLAGAGLSAAGGVMALDLDELAALGSAGLHQTQDHFVFSDNGTEKKITFSNLQDAVFADISGDATVAAGGALTIAANAVQDGMVHDDVAAGLSGDGLSAASGVMKIDVNSMATALAGNIANADLFAVYDASSTVHKKVSFEWVAKSVFADISGDIDINSSGVAVIQGGAVEGTMLDSSVAGTGLTLNGGNIDVVAAQTAITSVKNDALVVGRATGNDHIDFSTGGTVGIETNNVARVSVTDASTTVSNNLIVSGDLTVQGDTTTLNVTNLLVEDKIIQVAKGANDVASSQNSGILFGRDHVDGARLLYRSENGGRKTLVAMEGSGSNSVDIKADRFYGDGSNLSGVSATGVSNISAARQGGDANNAIMTSNNNGTWSAENLHQIDGGAMKLVDTNSTIKIGSQTGTNDYYVEMAKDRLEPRGSGTNANQDFQIRKRGTGKVVIQALKLDMAADGNNQSFENLDLVKASEFYTNKGANDYLRLSGQALNALGTSNDIGMSIVPKGAGKCEITNLQLQTHAAGNAKNLTNVAQFSATQIDSSTGGAFLRIAGEVVSGQGGAVLDLRTHLKLEVQATEFRLKGNTAGALNIKQGADEYMKITTNNNFANRSIAFDVGALVPKTNNTGYLGSSTNKWSKVYAQEVHAGDLCMSNDRGAWRLIEENDFLTLRNEKTGKRYKFNMTLLPEDQWDPDSNWEG